MSIHRFCSGDSVLMLMGSVCRRATVRTQHYSCAADYTVHLESGKLITAHDCELLTTVDSEKLVQTVEMLSKL